MPKVGQKIGKSAASTMAEPPKQPPAEPKPAGGSVASWEKAKAKLNAGEVIHPQVKVSVCTGDNALTAAQVKTLLGYQEDGEKPSFGANFLFINEAGRKVRLRNNMANRPFTLSNAEMIADDILNGRWRFNCENMIVGRTGLCLSIQHRGVGLIIAADRWNANPDKYPCWKTEPAIETLIAFGAPEDDQTVNTIDTGKSRSLTEVIFRSDIFGEMPTKNRLRAAGILHYAIMCAWGRTGAGLAARSASKRSHAKSLDFFSRHKRLRDAVLHIHEENSTDNRIGAWIRLGTAAGLLYLMGCSTSERSKYTTDENPNEKSLDWSMWDRACEFWVNFVSGDASSLKDAVTKHADYADDNVRAALFIKAWREYSTSENGFINPKFLEFTNDELGQADNGETILLIHPTVDGIDVGPSPAEADEADLIADDPTEAEIEERAAAIKSQNGKKKVGKDAPVVEAPAAPTKGVKSGKQTGKYGSYKPGVTVLWVDDPKREPWQGRLIKIDGNTAELEVQTGHAGAGTKRKVPITFCQPTQPEAK